jgi:hypothetical protein
MTAIDTFVMQYQAIATMRDGMLAGLSDAEGYWQPRPDVPPICWHIAHVARVSAGVLLGAGKGQYDLLPAAWNEFYQMGGKLPTPITRLPALSTVVPELAKVDAAILAFVRTLAPAQLGETMPHRKPGMPDFLKTFADALARIPIHCTHHHGEVMLLRRLQGKPNLR